MSKYLPAKSGALVVNRLKRPVNSHQKYDSASSWVIVIIDEAYDDPIASIEPVTWFLGNARVAAIAHTKGSKPKELDYVRTNEQIMDKLF